MSNGANNNNVIVVDGDVIVVDGDVIPVIPNEKHEWLCDTKLAAFGYGVSESVIRDHKSNHADELIEDKHFISVENIDAGNLKRVTTFWTKRGIVRLGFFIRSERAKIFRDKAEDLIVNEDQLHQRNEESQKLFTEMMMRNMEFMSHIVGKMGEAIDKMSDFAAAKNTTRRRRTKKAEEEFVQREIEPGYLSVPKGCRIPRDMTSTAKSLWKHKIVEILKLSDGGSAYVSEIVNNTAELFDFERDRLLDELTKEGVIELLFNQSNRDYNKYILRRCFNGY